MTDTLRFHHGSEPQSVDFWSGSNGWGSTLKAETVITSWSLGALRFTPAGGTPWISFLGEGFDYGSGKWIDNNRNWHGVACWHMYVYSLPTAGNRFYFWNMSDAVIQRRSASIKDDGAVEMRGEGSPGGVTATSTGKLETGKWYVCTLFCTSSAFQFIARDRDSGVTVVDVSGTASNATRYCTWGCKYASYGDIIMDNFVWESDATVGNVDDPVNLMTTKYSINMQKVKGAGYYTGGTNDWTYVDEIPHDGDTTTQVIDSAQFTHVLTPTSTFPAAVGTVYAVMGLAISRNNACTGSSNVRVLMRSGSTDYDPAGGWCSTSYVNPKSFRTTDPATSAAWTVSAVDSLQVGCVESGTNAAGIITAVHTEVLYSTYKLERIPEITYTLHMLDDQGLVYNERGEAIPYDEIFADRWIRYLDMELPSADDRADMWLSPDMAYIEGVTVRQDDKTQQVSIANSPDDFVERLVTKIALSSGTGV